MPALLQENEPVLPKAHDIALAEQSSKELAALFPKKERDFQMLVKVDKREATITFPFKVYFEVDGQNKFRVNGLGTC
jgi:hypothetical protein